MTKLEKFIQTTMKVDASYFLRGGFWTTCGQVVGLIGGIITTSLFAHILTENEYGTYRYLVGIAVILSSFSLTGLSQAVMQTAAQKYRNFYFTSVRVGLVYSFGIAFTGMIGSVYYFINGNITLSIGCFLVALLQPLVSTYNHIPSFLQGSRRFRESTFLHTFKITVLTVTSLSAILLTENILILLATYLTTQTCVNIAGHLYYKPSKESEVPEKIVQKYLSYAKNTSVRNLVSLVANRLDAIIVFQQLGAAQLALYAIASIIPEQIKGSLKNLGALITPKYAQHFDLSTIKQNVPKRSLQLFILLCIIMFLYIIIAPYLYQLLFPKYEAAVFYTQIIALGFPAFVLSIPHSALQAQLKERQLSALTLIGSSVQILLLLLLIPFLGIIGAILAKIIYRYFVMFISFYLLHKTA